MSSGLAIVHLYPTVLGLYGDRGNALILADRSKRRGLDAEVIAVEPGQALPTNADIYLLGGGEDLAQITATELLAADRGLHHAAQRGAPILAVCAGMQILGEWFWAGGRQVDGLGMLDITTSPGSPRAVGELVSEPLAHDLPTLTGYENHGGRTTLGADAQPFGRVTHGIGNGVGDTSEGALAGRIIGTYLHGPALARNPALADLLLEWAVGLPLTPLIDETADALRAERLRAVVG